jgi:hypothetical protein
MQWTITNILVWPTSFNQFVVGNHLLRFTAKICEYLHNFRLDVLCLIIFNQSILQTIDINSLNSKRIRDYIVSLIF